MFKRFLIALLSVLILSGVCFAQEEATQEPTQEDSSRAVAETQPPLVLEDIQICTGVENRQPVGAGTVFTDNVEKLYCFTKIAGATDTVSIYHVWYMGDKEVSKVSLSVKSASWRTWSSKLVNMGVGKGRVEVLAEDGTLLGKTEFEIQKAAEVPEKAAEETPAEQPAEGETTGEE
jgi:hypothetical protein